MSNNTPIGGANDDEPDGPAVAPQAPDNLRVVAQAVTSKLHAYYKAAHPGSELSLQSLDMINRYLEHNADIGKRLDRVLDLDRADSVNTITQSLAIAHVATAASSFFFTHTQRDTIRALKQLMQFPGVQAKPEQKEIVDLFDKFSPVFQSFLGRTAEVDDIWSRQQKIWSLFKDIAQSDTPDRSNLLAKQRMIEPLKEVGLDPKSAMLFANKSPADQELTLLKPLKAKLETLRSELAPGGPFAALAVSRQEPPRLIELCQFAETELTSASKCMQDMIDAANKAKTQGSWRG